MDVLRAKWNVEILTAILCGQSRFKDMMTAVKGISEKVLSGRLRQMADDRLIEKQECYGYPPLETLRYGIDHFDMNKLTYIRQNKRTL